MPQVMVEEIEFLFPGNWTVTKLDDWKYYRSQFARFGNGVNLICSNCNTALLCKNCSSKKTAGIKACDLLAVQGTTSWLIEVKDYRNNIRTKPIDLADEVALKVRDSLAILMAAHTQTNNHSTEKQIASITCQTIQWRVILHLEQPLTPSRLFPRAIDPALVMQKLKGLVKAIDPHPLVTESSNMCHVGWSASCK